MAAHLLDVVSRLQIDIELCAAKGIDRLLGIAHKKDALGSLGHIGQKQRFKNSVLDAVGILKLIDQDGIVTIADAPKGRIAALNKRIHLGQKRGKTLDAVQPLKFAYAPRTFLQKALEKRFKRRIAQIVTVNPSLRLNAAAMFSKLGK